MRKMTIAGTKMENSISKQMYSINKDISDVENWKIISEQLCKLNAPFVEHHKAYQLVYEARTANNPGPAYIPDCNRETNVKAACNATGNENVDDLYQFSINNRDKFYNAMLGLMSIKFQEPATSILAKDSDPTNPEWLPNSKLNIVDSCFNSNGSHKAIIYYDQAKKIKVELTYDQLENKINNLANIFADEGVSVDDAVAIYMPMNIDAVASYLALIKIGAVVVSIADSFSTNEIESRLSISNSKYIVTQYSATRASKVIDFYNKVVSANAPKALVFTNDESQQLSNARGDISITQDYDEKKTSSDTIYSDAKKSINILFSSGTTGTPKAILWDQTTAIKAAMDGYLHQDITTSDIVAWPTNLGWMMGPWLIFATFINGATMALYSDAPTTKDFCDFVQDTKVSILGIVPSIVACWRNSNILEGKALSHIKLFSSTGETSTPEDMLYLMSKANYAPVVEYCGGTEIGGAFVSSTLEQEIVPSAFAMPTFGTKLEIIDDNGNSANKGEMTIVPPAMGLSRQLLNKDNFEVYYKGMPIRDGIPLRRHGDEFQLLEGNHYRALGRTDDTMNLGAIKVSSAEIERVIAATDGLTECAAIGVPPKNGGPERLVIFAVTSNASSDELRTNMQKLIKSELNPLFKIHDVVITDKLPRTSSNKVMRRVLRDEYIKNF